MMQDTKIGLRAALLQEALVRTREGIRMTMMAQELESQGWLDWAEATREVTRHNEVERIRLRAKLDAIEG